MLNPNISTDEIHFNIFFYTLPGQIRTPLAVVVTLTLNVSFKNSSNSRPWIRGSMAFL